MKTTKKTSITTNSHQLKDSSRWSQPVSLIDIDHSRLNPLMAISPILIFAFLLPLSFNLLTGATALAVAPTIGLSILATDGNTNNNITIQSPSGGGIAVGRHTLVINTNSYKGYNVTLNSNSSNSNLTSTNGSSNNSNNNIVPVAGTLTNPTSLAQDNTWGVAIPGRMGFNQSDDYTNTNTSAKYAAVPVQGASNNSIMNKALASATNGDNQPVVYGVKTASLTKAGSYKATVTYTATAQLPAKPTITSITPNSYQLGTDASSNPNASKITIAGTDLGSTNEVYVDTNGNSQKDTGEECTNLQVVSDTEVTCNVPTASTINAGSYNVTVTAQGGETTLSNGFNYTKAKDAAVCESGNDKSSCSIEDMDSNMIPVKWVGQTQDTNSDIAGSYVDGWAIADTGLPGDWYDYSQKKWANAVTISANKLNLYKNSKPGTVVKWQDILGMYTYIPRYAYEVMRRDATDKYVNLQEFSIKFETSNDSKKIPAKCNQSGVDYRTGCGISRTYGAATGTTWATHPAFTYGDRELNGFWVGKFETGGTNGQRSYDGPTTVRPGVNTLTAFSGWQVAHDAALSMGVENPSEKYILRNYAHNTQNLKTYMSHQITNNEWGAITYLATSQYGSGVSGVYPNENYDESNDSQGKVYYTGAGCGPLTDAQRDYDEPNGVCNSYATEQGQLASTTDNVWGIYDMVGGMGDTVIAFIDNTNPYSISNGNVNFYDPNVFGADDFTNLSKCTYEACGGQALYETQDSRSSAQYSSAFSWGRSSVEFGSLAFSKFSTNTGFYIWGRGGDWSGNGGSSIFSQGTNLESGVRAVLQAP